MSLFDLGSTIFGLANAFFFPTLKIVFSITQSKVSRNTTVFLGNVGFTSRLLTKFSEITLDSEDEDNLLPLIKNNQSAELSFRRN